MDDVVKVAQGLTKAQRESIAAAEDMMSNHGGYPFFTARHTGEPWPMGVAEFMTLKTDRLTRLGIAVRSYIMGEHTETGS